MNDPNEIWKDLEKGIRRYGQIQGDIRQGQKESFNSVLKLEKTDLLELF